MILPYCALSIALSACGSTPSEGTATGTGTGTGTDGPSAATDVTLPTPTTGDSDSDGATDSGNSISGDTSTSAPGTVTDATSSTTGSTDTTGPVDPSATDGSSSSSGDPPGETDTDTTGGTGTTGTTGDTTGDTTTGDTTGEPVVCGVQLDATIRDFKVSHPDFEDYLGAAKGLVKVDLGPDNKPVFNKTGGVINSEASFKQWYNDVPDVNQKLMIVLDLMEIMPGVYSYSNNSFFPADNQLWGNEGNNHNFHFTTVIDTS